MPLRKSALGLLAAIAALAAPAAGWSGAYSLVGSQFFLQPASLPQTGALPARRAQPDPETGRGAVALRPGAGSLFRGRSGGLFAAIPKAPPAAKQLMALIASAEAGKAGYDAVQHGARQRPPKNPTQMTIAEIYAWIEATPGQPHAIGRYQLIPATLRRLVEHQGVKPQARFSPELQDRLAHQLIEEAGYTAFLAAGLDRGEFMLNLAKIWAGLPTASGKSYYDGYAGNRATLTWAHFEAEMQRIFPGRAAAG
ncbi:hypothetical protein ACUXV3_17235 [Roseobacteraceae bacterium NS-SX3]